MFIWWKQNDCFPMLWIVIPEIVQDEQKDWQTFILPFVSSFLTSYPVFLHFPYLSWRKQSATCRWMYRRFALSHNFTFFFFPALPPPPSVSCPTISSFIKKIWRSQGSTISSNLAIYTPRGGERS